MADFTVGSLVCDGSDNTDQGDSYPHKSAGSRAFSHDLMTLHNLWIAPTQMLQLAPGMCWCKTCGDVRPNTYFDVTEWDERGRITAVDSKGKPIAWDGVRFPTKWSDECKSCANARDPKLRRSKYCSACKVDHPRDEFADDDDYTDGKYPSCYASERRRKNAANARKKWLDEGREMRSWTRQRVTG